MATYTRLARAINAIECHPLPPYLQRFIVYRVSWALDVARHECSNYDVLRVHLAPWEVDTLREVINTRLLEAVAL